MTGQVTEGGAGPGSRSAGWMAAGLVLAALVRGLALLRRGIDPDESQHLHAAWQVAIGLVPHRDFWEHHAALFYYGLAPLIRLFPDDPTVYLAARGLMLAAAVVALWLTSRLAKRVEGATPWLAVLLLATLSEFTEQTTETRPDVPAVVAWLAGVLALIRWRLEGRARWAGLAGLAQGTALALTTKALFGLPGTLAVLLAGAGLPSRTRVGPGRPLARTARGLAAFGAGVVAAPALLLGLLAGTGGGRAVTAFVQQVVVDNVGFVDFVKTPPVGGAGLGFLAVGLAGMVLAARRYGVSVVGHEVHGPLLLPAASWAAVLALPQTPAVYGHAWLPVWPVLAVYGALAGRVALDWARRGAPWRRAMAAIGAIVVLGLPAVESVYGAVRDQAGPQLALARRLLLGACPGEAVLDGTALAVFRPSAQRYGVLITGVREWIARGVLPEEAIEADLRHARAPVGVRDRRVRGLIGPVARFLDSHYVAVDGDLLVTGGEARVDGGAGGGRKYVDLLREGPYRLTATTGVAVALDGSPVTPGWLRLSSGPHEVTWTGGPGLIRLTLGDCRTRHLAGTGAIEGAVP